MTDAYREIIRLEREGIAAALVVVTSVRGHTPQVMGAKMVVRADGSTLGTIGGGRVEHEATARALEAITQGRAAQETYKLKAELGMCCGGEMSIYVEPIVGRHRLHLFGAGHVAAPTAEFAARCGFHVTVVDEREDWNSEERYPDAATRYSGVYGDYLQDLDLGPRDYVVITTHNHDYDREILSRALETGAGYIGMIGSTRKAAKTLQQLRGEGKPEETLRRAHTPIGLDILAETPEEIAVAIVGEMIRHRREQSSEKSTRANPVDSKGHGADEAP